MKTYKKFGLIFSATLAFLATLSVLHGSALAAGFTQAQIQNARAYFVDNTAQALNLVVGGQTIPFTTKDGGENRTYSPTNPNLFCVPAVNSIGAKPIPSNSYLLVVFGSSATTGSIASGGINDPAAVPDSNLYAGTNPQNCQRALPNNKSVTVQAAAPSGALFTDKNIGTIKGGDFVFDDAANIHLNFGGKIIHFYDQQPEDNTRNFSPKDSSDSAFFCTSISGVTFNNADQSKDSIPISFQVAYYDTTNSNQCTKKTLSLSISNPGKVATQVLQWNSEAIESITGSLSLSKQSGSDTVFLESPNDACGGSYVVVLSQKGGNSGTLFQLQGGKADSGTAVGKAFPSCSVKSQRSVLIAGSEGVALANGGGAASPNASSDTCAVNAGGFSLTWLFCPVLDAADGLASTLTNLFEDQLSFRVSDLSRNTGANGVNAAWSLIRDIASALLVIVMLIMVISQAIGGGPFDAYTVRKMLPRLVAAVILMQISWALLGWVVDRFDDIGQGLKAIMYLPFRPGNLDDFWALLSNAHVSTGGAAAASWVGLVGVGIGVAIALPTVLMFCFIAIVSVLVGLAVLIFRKILIIMALIFAPIALLAWLIPGTEKYFKLWYDNLLKALFMFPLAVAIVASGRIFAYVIGTQGNGTFLNFFLVMVGFFGPLFILPKTFKWGGSLMQSVGSNAFKLAEKGLIGKEAKPVKYMQNRQQEWTDQRRRGSYERVSTNAPFNRKRFWQYPLDRLRSGKWDPLKQAPGYKDVGKRSVQAYVQKGESLQHEDEAAAETKLIRERQKHRAEGGQHDLYLQAIADGVDEYYDPSLNKNVHVGKRDHLEQMAARRQLAKLGAGMNWRYLENYYESTRQELDNARSSGSKERIDKAVAELSAAEAMVADTPDAIEQKRERVARAQAGLMSARRPRDAQRIAHAEEAARDMRKFFDDNVDTILPKMPHIYKSISQAADADPSAIAGMHGVEVEAILAQLSQNIKNGDTGAQVSLTTFLQNFQRAVENSERGGPQLENGELRAVKAFLDDNGDVANKLLLNINGEEFHGRQGIGRDRSNPDAPTRSLPLLGRSTELEGRLDAKTAQILGELQISLAGKINEDGFVKPASAQAAQRAQQSSQGAQGELNIQHEPQIIIPNTSSSQSVPPGTYTPENRPPDEEPDNQPPAPTS